MSSTGTTSTRTTTRALPFNLQAEESVLGAMMLEPSRIPEVRVIVRAEDFFRQPHRIIAAAVFALHDRGDPTDVVATVEQLRRLGQLQLAGGDLYVLHLVETVPIPASAGYYARIVADHARLRAFIDRESALLERAYEVPEDVDGFLSEAALSQAEGGVAVRHRSNLVDGAAFVLDAPADIPSVWGPSPEVLWAPGEPLLIVGPDGTGKTTLGNQLVLATAGIIPEVLGFPVNPVEGRVGLLATDRPQQIRRRFAGMVGESEREELRERLLVHEGPLEFSIVSDPRSLASWAEGLGLAALFIDSLGATVAGLTKDEIGSAVALSCSHVVAAGIELCVLFHPRKPTADNRKPTSISDVYGSRWITAMAGSVISLWGDPGDPIVEFRHLKQPQTEVGPFQVKFESTAGFAEVLPGANLLAILRAASRGLTAKAAAEVLFVTVDPRPAQVEKARRKLEGLCRRDLAVGRAGATAREPTTYFATVPPGTEELR